MYVCLKPFRATYHSVYCPFIVNSPVVCVDIEWCVYRSIAVVDVASSRAGNERCRSHCA